MRHPHKLQSCDVSPAPYLPPAGAAGAVDARMENELPFGACLIFALIVLLTHLNKFLRLSIADVDFKVLLSLRLGSPNASSTLLAEYAEMDAVHGLPCPLSNAVK